MRIHHLDCGRLRMLGGPLIDGRSRSLRAELTCHVMAVEADNGDITLIDTGLGKQAIERGSGEWFGRGWSGLFAPDADPNLTVHAQLAALGLEGEVTNILLTHMDLDHTGGLADFPEARVHVHRPEIEGQLNPRTAGDRNRYRAVQFAHDPKWQIFDLADSSEDWFGFRAAGDIPGLPSEVRIVGLSGHSNGHVGVAVALPGDRWVLHGGDAYFLPTELDLERPSRTLGIAAFERFACVNRGLMEETQARLRGLLRDHGDDVDVFSSHSMADLRRLTQQPSPAAVA